MSVPSEAATYADSAVERVCDDPMARLALLRQMCRVPTGVDRECLPYRRAASAIMRAQLQRGLLNPPTGAQPGSRPSDSHLPHVASSKSHVRCWDMLSGWSFRPTVTWHLPHMGDLSRILCFVASTRGNSGAGWCRLQIALIAGSFRQQDDVKRIQDDYLDVDHQPEHV